MPIIHYLSDQRHVAVNDKTTILEASLQAEIPHAHVCGGYARCTTCRVLIVEGLRNCSPRNPDEQRLAERLHFSPNIRLACQTQITGDVKLRRLVLDDKDILLSSQIRPGAVAGSVGQEQEVGILFAGLQRFSDFTENNLAYDAIHILNRYIYEMKQVVERNGGTVINVLSDGIIAVFGIENNQQTALRTVKAGLEMLEAMEQLSLYVKSIHRAKLDLNIGLHYGPAILGMIGADSRQGQTAIGHAVNLVSSIGVTNELLGTKLLVSNEVYRQVKKEVQIGKQVAIKLTGSNKEHTLYEILGIDKKLVLEPVVAADNSLYRPPAPHNLSKELAIAVGGILLGIFLAGFFGNLASNKAILILVYTIVGLLGAALLAWGLLRHR